MDKIAGVLLERELLDGSEFEALMNEGPADVQPDECVPPLPEARGDGLPRDGFLA